LTLRWSPGDLDTCDQQRGKGMERAIGLLNVDVWEVGGREDEIGMIDQVGLAVSHVNGEGPKWSGVEQVANTLFHWVKV